MRQEPKETSMRQEPKETSRKCRDDRTGRVWPARHERGHRGSKRNSEVWCRRDAGERFEAEHDALHQTFHDPTSKLEMNA
eukprot:5370580-Pleurochrysis_carterae.AAC.1